jgi:hypothetical protein
VVLSGLLANPYTWLCETVLSETMVERQSASHQQPLVMATCVQRFKQTSFIPTKKGLLRSAHRRAHLAEHLGMMRFVKKKPFEG